jgi:hypothetical protein
MRRIKGKNFRKSSFSKNNPKTCVEVATMAKGVVVRNSMDPNGSKLEFTNEEWNAFITGVKNGEFEPVG